MCNNSRVHPKTHAVLVLGWGANLRHAGTSYIFMSLPGLFILEGMVGVTLSPTPVLVFSVWPLFISWLRVWHSLPGLHDHVEGLLEVGTVRQPGLLPNPINHVCCNSLRPLRFSLFFPCWRPVSSLHYCNSSETSLSSCLVSSSSVFLCTPGSWRDLSNPPIPTHHSTN